MPLDQNMQKKCEMNSQEAQNTNDEVLPGNDYARKRNLPI